MAELVEVIQADHLEACPRCHSRMTIVSDGEPTPFYSVNCTGCQIEFHCSALSPEKAAAIWNTRPPASGVAEEAWDALIEKHGSQDGTWLQVGRKDFLKALSTLASRDRP